MHLRESDEEKTEGEKERNGRFLYHGEFILRID